MAKKKEIDGKEFGEKLLRPIFKPYLDKKGNLKLTQLRKDKKFKKQWQLLWSWRDLIDNEEIKRFFRVQSFLRSNQLEKQLSIFCETIGASFALAYEFFVTGRVEKYANEPLTVANDLIENSLKELMDYKKNLPFISLFDIQLFGSRLYKRVETKKVLDSLNVVTRYTPKTGNEVVEVFSEKEFERSEIRAKKLERIKENLFKKKPKSLGDKLNQSSWKNVQPDDLDFIWGRDASTLLQDRERKYSTLYLRVDLNRYDTITLKNIDQLLKTKIKQIKCKPQPRSYKYWYPLETSLMIYDLESFGFKEKETATIMGYIDATLGESYIKRKLQSADKLTINATRRDFPFQYKRN